MTKAEQLLSFANPELVSRMMSMKNHTEYDEDDTCATCWHCHTTTLKSISKTGLFCAVTHNPVHPMSDTCEHFKLNKYFAEKQAQKGREG